MNEGPYLVNDAGDVWARRLPDGTEASVDPDSFGWRPKKSRVKAEQRRTLDDVRGLPGFRVDVEDGPSFIPGKRPSRSVPWLEWKPGTAPPAAVQSRNGVDGTLSYFDRLSDALGRVTKRLPGRPDRSPFLVNDFVGARAIRVHYEERLQPDGSGRVYLVTDGDGIKIGYTSSSVTARIAGLQTGNPRSIRAVVTVHGASVSVEEHLHKEFAKFRGSGEWFDWQPLVGLALAEGGWELLLRSVIGEGPDIEIHDVDVDGTA